METTQLLLDSQSKLEQTLVLLQEKHLHQFLELFLCYQLGKDNESAESRRLSNILLKRSLDGVKKDDVVKQWRLLEDDVDLQSLIVESLVNMNQQSSLPHLKQSTLVTLCYVCEESFHHLKHEGPASGDSFIKKVLPHLVPMLLVNLRKAEEDNDHSGDVSLISRRCLCLLSSAGGDELVSLAIPFIMENIAESRSWQDREASICAFGSIVHVSTINHLSPHVPVLLRFLLTAIKDDNEDVRETNVWTLDRILPFCYSFSAEALEVLEESVRKESNVPETASRVLSLCFMMIKQLSPAVDLPQMEGLQQVTGSDVTLSASQLRAEQSRPKREWLQQRVRGSDITFTTSGQSQSQPTAQQQPQPQQPKLTVSVSERKCLVELITLVRAHLEGNGELDKEMWGICLLEEEKSEAILLKFLRATDCSVSKSLNMFKNALKWRTDEKINELCQHSVVDHAPSIFMYGLDRKGHPVVYDNIYHDFAKNIFDTRGQLDHTVAGFIKSRDMFMEMTLRKLGGDSSFLYIFNVLNEHGLTKQDLNLVTELTKEKLKLSQKRYPNFAATQLFINCSLMEYLQYQMSRIHRSPRSKSEVVMAQTSKSLKTLIKLRISIKAGKRKTVEIQCPNKCEILLTFRSTRNCLVYNSAFIPGTFRTVVGQTSFTQASDKLEFTDIAGLEIEGDLRRHSFKVTEPGKLVVAGDNPTSSKAMLLYSYRVNYNVN
ncbi:hypothetical protein YC2023_068493 [Brassica napus]